MLPRFGFGGDVALQPGTQRFAQEIAKDGKHQATGISRSRQRSGTRPLEWNPGQGRREEHGGGQVRSTTRVDGEFAFTGAQPGHRFIDRVANIVHGQIAEQVRNRSGWNARPDFCLHMCGQAYEAWHVPARDYALLREREVDQVS